MAQLKFYHPNELKNEKLKSWLWGTAMGMLIGLFVGLMSGIIGTVSSADHCIESELGYICIWK